MSELYQLRCRECGKTWGNAPRSFCEDCFSPLEVSYDYEALKKKARKENLAGRAFNMWRYAEFLPLYDDFTPTSAIGGTPLVASRKLASKWGINNLYLKNDAVCFPSLSFKDRVVGTALVAARRFGFETVGCSSTGNLANAVAAQSAQQGFDACVFIPADLEPAKVLNTAVYGARIVRILGNYDHVNRLCAQIADRFQWGLVNVNLRPYYTEGAKTHGFEIAEQFGWRLPQHTIVPTAGGTILPKVYKAYKEFIELGLVQDNGPKIYSAQAAGCNPVVTAIHKGVDIIEPQKPNTIAKSIAIGNPADGYYVWHTVKDSGGWGESATDREIIDAIKLLARTEGIWTEPAGGTTLAVTMKLLAQGRIPKDESIVVSITGNGLKTQEVVVDDLPYPVVIEPKLSEFDKLLESKAAAPHER